MRKKERSMKRYLAVLIILTGMVVLCAGCASDPYHKGFKAYRGGDYLTAKEELTPLAEQGDDEAQLHLGLMYRDGSGVMPYLREAEKWLQKSAEQENMNARVALGAMYADQQSPLQNDVKALMWFNFAAAQGSKEARSLREGLMMRMTPSQTMEAQRLGREFKSEKDYQSTARNLRPKAESGDASALMRLGLLYYNGQGVSRDCSEAARLFLLAAEKGDAYAQSNLGYLYEMGEGVPQDYREAAKWYLKAAEQGNTQAQFFVGRLYEKGRGAPQSDVNALLFYTLASVRGDARATTGRDRLTVWMPPAQIAEAQRLAREFKIVGK
jgi:TPR repeat protein